MSEAPLYLWRRNLHSWEHVCVGIWALRAMKGNSDGAGNSDVAGT